MFERLSERTRTVVMFAREHAWMLNNREVTPEHVVIAAIVGDTRVGSLLRGKLGGQAAELWRQLLRLEPRPTAISDPMTLAFSADTRQLFELGADAGAMQPVCLGWFVTVAIDRTVLGPMAKDLRHLIETRDD